jgi:5-methylcytosine-specific restriction enzyme A
MKYCGEQGCKTLISSGRYCANHKRKQKKKVVYSKNKSFYRTRAWKDLKLFCYQRDRGCCQRCKKFVFGQRAHHHHIVPIQIDPSLKLDADNVMTLCSKCHPIVEAEAMEQYKKKPKFDWKLS